MEDSPQGVPNRCCAHEDNDERTHEAAGEDMHGTRRGRTSGLRLTPPRARRARRRRRRAIAAARAAAATPQSPPRLRLARRPVALRFARQAATARLPPAIAAADTETLARAGDCAATGEHLHFKTLKARACLTILLLQNIRTTLAEDSENQTNKSEHDGGFVVVDIEEEKQRLED